jgi:hypothetical protein
MLARGKYEKCLSSMLKNYSESFSRLRTSGSDFIPWCFSVRAQLVEAFFALLAAN